ncbi:dsDNA-mimic protein [Klebsiella variicola]|nr:dsDNA-mimic protein [Klebsiella variicola]
MDMDLNNRLTEDETLEQAYDIFLELAADNLDPADIILFNLQFEERGGAELFGPVRRLGRACGLRSESGFLRRSGDWPGGYRWRGN